jgi:hypothetical protein
MTIILQGAERPVVRIFAADEYLEHVVDGHLTRLKGDHNAASFLSEELAGWERVAARLTEWTAKNDGSENPYSPPITLKHASAVLRGLRRRLAAITQ